MFGSSGCEAARGVDAHLMSATEIVSTPERNASPYAALGQPEGGFSPQQLIAGISARRLSITVAGVQFEYRGCS